MSASRPGRTELNVAVIYFTNELMFVCGGYYPKTAWLVFMKLCFVSGVGLLCVCFHVVQFAQLCFGNYSSYLLRRVFDVCF